ncbi:MAG TPA: helix-turn-helix domain-containing protein [Pyrinomonadaceae bacterium]|jgi:DNA-binding protein Fis
MSGTAVRDHQEIRLLEGGSSGGSSDGAASENKVKTLKQLVVKLLREVQSLNQVQSLEIQQGIDFYDEVSRFEIDIIKRALLHTGGNQVRAARLLNLKVTTLNSKIKHYQIDPDAITIGTMLLESADDETVRKHA